MKAKINWDLHSLQSQLQKDKGFNLAIFLVTDPNLEPLVKNDCKDQTDSNFFDSTWNVTR